MAEEIAELDRIDRVLVSALQNDARLRLEDLARMVKLVPSSVHDRLRRLERDGVIRRWTIDVDVSVFGLDVLAYVGVQSSKPCSKLMPFLEPITAVEECHSVAGSRGMMLKVRVPSTSALLDLIEQVRQIPGVEGTETSIVLRTQFDRPITLPGAKAKARAG